jgi:hypothetical protein
MDRNFEASNLEQCQKKLRKIAFKILDLSIYPSPTMRFSFTSEILKIIEIITAQKFNEDTFNQTTQSIKEILIMVSEVYSEAAKPISIITKHLSEVSSTTCKYSDIIYSIEMMKAALIEASNKLNYISSIDSSKSKIK